MADSCPGAIWLSQAGLVYVHLQATWEWGFNVATDIILTGELFADEDDEFWQPPSPPALDRRVSVDTVATEPWLRPSTTETLKNFLAGRRPLSKEPVTEDWEGPSTYHGWPQNSHPNLKPRCLRPAAYQGWSQITYAGAWGLYWPVEFALYSWAIDPVAHNLRAKEHCYYLTSRYQTFNICLFSVC